MTDTEFSRSERRRLEDTAMNFQRQAAYSYDNYVISDRNYRRTWFQCDAAYFAGRARACLFELIGSEPEEYAALAGFLLVLASWGFWWAATPA